jgi:hypothetical protein
MKVLSVIRAESVRALRPIAGDLGYPPTAVSRLVNQYGFLGLPKPEDLVNVDPAKGLTFSAGRFAFLGGREVAIDYLQVFPAGLSVTTHTNTTEADFILESILEWAHGQFGLQFEPIKPGIAHGSQLEVRLEKSLADLFPMLSAVGEAISENLDPWWGTKLSFEPAHLNFWADKSKYPLVPPQGFRLERREGIPFEQMVYYSEAPMSTDKHIQVLTTLERVCLENLK